MPNAYSYSVPFTEEELIRDYVQLGMTQVEFAAKHGTTQKVVWRAMKKMGVPSRRAAKRNQGGVLNDNWKGGRVLSAKRVRQRGERIAYGNGYYYIRDSQHPNANKGGYVGEHVAVVAEARQRPLVSGEIVHHINLMKHDNRLENLAITDRTTHANWHNQLEELAVEFMQEGLIEFDALHGYRRAK